MKNKNPNSSPSRLQTTIFRTHFLMIVLLALVLGAAGIGFSLREESRQRDLNLQNVAEAIAHSQPVAAAVTGEGKEALTEYLDALKASLADIDVISVVGPQGERLYHSNKDLIGTAFDGTIPDFSQTDFYSVDESGPSGQQRRAYAAIRGEAGEPEGFVMAILLRSSITSRNLRIFAVFLPVILLAVLVELFLSYRLSARVRERLMGYEPDTFSAMYLIRDNILEGLEEGVIAADDTGVQFMNGAARRMLGGAGADPEKQAERLLGSILRTGEKESAVPVDGPEGRDILMDRLPVRGDGAGAGAIGILHDRTEFTRQAEELAGTKYLVDSMRANNHDFTNKLHVILGLLQMDEVERAKAYIENATVVQRETVSAIMHRVDAPAVAALLIGKTARASELNVRLLFQKDSQCRREELPVSETVIVTVLGNLIDNALDAMNYASEEGGEREITVGLHTRPGTLYMTVDDTGPGMSEEVMSHIFEKGFSTKGEGRGTGLYEVRRTVESLGGEITLESQEGEGTSFTVSFAAQAQEERA
ncbi:MAG: Spo0B domain-containing protein [Lachnospiraceae bacterium]|nr:Spo0B domain-containing protein [Lachnospiraceae bacterium]